MSITLRHLTLKRASLDGNGRVCSISFSISSSIIEMDLSEFDTARLKKSMCVLCRMSRYISVHQPLKCMVTD
jgi:hypothetical protein